jgi:hypothetical protein
MLVDEELMMRAHATVQCIGKLRLRCSEPRAAELGQLLRIGRTRLLQGIGQQPSGGIGGVVGATQVLPGELFEFSLEIFGDGKLANRGKVRRENDAVN